MAGPKPPYRGGQKHMGPAQTGTGDFRRRIRCGLALSTSESLNTNKCLHIPHSYYSPMSVPAMSAEVSCGDDACYSAGKFLCSILHATWSKIWACWIVRYRSGCWLLIGKRQWDRRRLLTLRAQVDGDLSYLA